MAVQLSTDKLASRTLQGMTHSLPDPGSLPRTFSHSIYVSSFFPYLWGDFLFLFTYLFLFFNFLPCPLIVSPDVVYRTLFSFVLACSGCCCYCRRLRVGIDRYLVVLPLSRSTPRHIAFLPRRMRLTISSMDARQILLVEE